MEPTMEAGLEPAGGMKTVPGPVVQIDEGRIQAAGGTPFAMLTYRR